MHLKAKTYQSRRDFEGIFACAYCGYEEENWGYDDAYFHHTVIPGMECPKCHRTGGGITTDPTIPSHVTL